MKKIVRLLLLEITATDGKAIEHELSKIKLSFSCKHAGSQEAYLEELERSTPDIVLADCSFSQLDVLESFRVLKKLRLDIPFIVLGPMAEDIALQCLREGVDAYILKSALGRLPFSIANALKKRQRDREEAQVLAALQHAELYQVITEDTRDLVCVLDRTGCFLYASPLFHEILGYDPEELKSREAFSLLHPDDRETVRKMFLKSILSRDAQSAKYRCQTKAGLWCSLESTAVWIQNHRGQAQRAVVISRELLPGVTSRSANGLS